MKEIDTEDLVVNPCAFGSRILNKATRPEFGWRDWHPYGLHVTQLAHQSLGRRRVQVYQLGAASAQDEVLESWTAMPWR